MNFLETMREILKNEGLTGPDARDRAIADGPPPVMDEGRLTTGTTGIAPGCWVEWNSPALGVLMGEVIGVTATAVTVWHPLAESLRPIPATWVTRILPGRPPE